MCCCEFHYLKCLLEWTLFGSLPHCSLENTTTRPRITIPPPTHCYTFWERIQILKIFFKEAMRLLTSYSSNLFMYVCTVARPVIKRGFMTELSEIQHSTPDLRLFTNAFVKATSSCNCWTAGLVLNTKQASHQSIISHLSWLSAIYQDYQNKDNNYYQRLKDTWKQRPLDQEIGDIQLRQDL